MRALAQRARPDVPGRRRDVLIARQLRRPSEDRNVPADAEWCLLHRELHVEDQYLKCGRAIYPGVRGPAGSCRERQLTSRNVIHRRGMARSARYSEIQTYQR